MPSLETIRSIFDLIGAGRKDEFFEHIDDNVDWTVKGTYCPISGRYPSKAAFHAGTEPLSSTWSTPLKLVVQEIISDGGDKAAVMLKAEDVVCKNGLKFSNEYVWWLTFNKDNKIVKVDAFMDTDLATKAIAQNPQ